MNSEPAPVNTIAFTASVDASSAKTASISAITGLLSALAGGWLRTTVATRSSIVLVTN
jgi:hypothetical protein